MFGSKLKASKLDQHDKTWIGAELKSSFPLHDVRLSSRNIMGRETQLGSARTRINVCMRLDESMKKQVQSTNASNTRVQ
ncbi:unnamed protein product [Sphenostylis stenocarpa]|uniref:Uncharacterized protein n=1 Tax=Sphenostylis stenocarpa TaxID=92480 RepID=A0AA86TBM0_9FABA|nr:unnamed protein product [Sphenostylis stenocarpa]